MKPVRLKIITCLIWRGRNSQVGRENELCLCLLPLFHEQFELVRKIKNRVNILAKALSVCVRDRLDSDLFRCDLKER